MLPAIRFQHDAFIWYSASDPDVRNGIKGIYFVFCCFLGLFLMSFHEEKLLLKASRRKKIIERVTHGNKYTKWTNKCSGHNVCTYLVSNLSFIYCLCFVLVQFKVSHPFVSSPSRLFIFSTGVCEPGVPAAGGGVCIAEGVWFHMWICWHAETVITLGNVDSSLSLSLFPQVGCKAIVCPSQFKTQMYCDMLRKICPEIESSKPGDIKSARYTHIVFTCLTAKHTAGEEVYRYLIKNTNTINVNLSKTCSFCWATDSDD